MDKRIEKTKKMLKRAMLELMESNSFRKITVKEVCDLACTSRITFYTYYDNKYDLLDDIARDMREETVRRFSERQKKNNAADDVVVRHHNMVDAILDTETQYEGIFTSKKGALADPEALSYYYEWLQMGIEEMEQQYEQVNPRYPVKQLSAFLVAGIGAYARTGQRDGRSKSKIRLEIMNLVTDLLHSDLFRR